MKFTLTLDDKQTVGEHHIQVCEEYEGVHQTYYVTPEQIIDLLSKATYKNKGQVTPMLSRNTIRVREYGNDMEIWTDIPSQQWDISFEGIPLKVGFPRIVFKYHIVKNLDKGNYNVFLQQCVAVQSKGAIKDNTPLYHFPYSHVSNGNVCMGSNQLPPITELTQLETYHAFFFQSPFGTDYGSHTSTQKSVSELLTDTFANKSFDEAVLIPMNQTFKEYFYL